MELLIIRHAPAEDREDFAKTGKADELRPLTAEGRAKMRRAAPGLKRIAGSIDLLASSKLLRAKQTAKIISRVFPQARVLELPQLSPDAAPADLVRWLKRRRERLIAVVGHEPHLSRLIAWLCAARAEPLTGLKKGQACLLRFSGRPQEGTAKIICSLKPGQLRKLR